MFAFIVGCRAVKVIKMRRNVSIKIKLVLWYVYDFDTRFQVTHLQRAKCEKSQGKTSDAGSQYRYGWVGKGIQPPSTPLLSLNTFHYTHPNQNAHSHNLRPVRYRRSWTAGPGERRNRWTDRQMDRQTAVKIDGHTTSLIYVFYFGIHYFRSFEHSFSNCEIDCFHVFAFHF